MGRLLVNSLLFGITAAASVGVANGQWGLPEGARPEIPPTDGCEPGARTTMECPARMECFIDNNYPKGGRCDCNPLWFKVPAKIPFDDSEWDDGFTANDCVDLDFSRGLMGTFYWLLAIVRVAYIYTNYVVIRELIRVKALKWNATAYSLFLLLWAAVAAFFMDLIYALNYMDADKTEYWYMARTVLYTYALQPASFIIEYEIGVTWIDLYDRTNKMSKSSSKNLKILRYSIRCYCFLMLVGFMTVIATGGHGTLMISSLVVPISGSLFTLIGGHLITKSLCPDKNDVANQNWKVAAAIRRAVKHNVGARIMEIISLLGLLLTSRNPVSGYTYGWFWFLNWFRCCIIFWGWLHYLIGGNRKHLKKYASHDASAYFGFSTIGLNKTLTTASSMASSRMSAISTRSSVLGGRSTVE